MKSRDVALIKAPRLAMSGKYQGVDQVIAALAPEVRNVHAVFTPQLREHIDELCRAYWKPSG